MICEICDKPHKTIHHTKCMRQIKNKERVNENTRRWYSLHVEQTTKIRRKYRKTPNGKAATLRAIRKYETVHPERRKAWNKAAKEIERLPCIICGDSSSHRHHPDIMKPLEVVMLCPLHHKQQHNLV